MGISLLTLDKYFTHSALKTCNIWASTQDFGGGIAQSIMWLTADQGVGSLIPAWSHTFVGIDHEIISRVLLLPSTDSRRVVVNYKQKYVHEVLANCLIKLAQEKSVFRLSDRPNMTIAVDWDVKNQTKPKQDFGTNHICKQCRLR